MSMDPQPMEPKLRGHLITLFDTYSAHLGLSKATLAARFHGDGRFYEALKGGTSIFSVFAYDKVVAEFAAVWPASLPWPRDIEKIQLSQVRDRPRKKRGRRNPAA